MKGHIQERKIALLAGGDLSQRQTRRLARHLDECADCSALLEFFRGDRRVISESGSFAISEEILEDVRHSVLDRLSQKNRAGSWLGAPVRWGAIAIALMACVALVVVWRERTPFRTLPATSSIKSQGTSLSAVAPRLAVHSEGAKLTAQAMKRMPAANTRATRPNALTATAKSLSWTDIARVTSDVSAEEQTKPRPDRIAVKLETSDPNVIIIWLASSQERGK